ncbi:TIGR04282 family arsenosugar biosynthesis glycosyltransferase [Streptomyces alboflavus]|uniref:TIGR04282 family arsenosugar biosynthesis glycosyltransferase n=1 Tax=Streptomyces alboflavus TaxID=67267 RepID=UPI0004C0B6AA|nr:TIGR04282 family arsenosugar biosynthesis glycosyltransferase [Streptomyces alboflavus]
MRSASTAAVLVMAKAPRPGTVKTRLHPLLGPQRCAVLQAALIRHTVETTTAAGLHTYLAYAADDTPAAYDLCPAPPAGVRVLRQRGTDLGQRMTAAVADVFTDGAGPLVVIGTDAPTLTGDDLYAAFEALTGADVVLGPALDGGYYLVGMHQPRPVLFGIDPALWSTDKVLAATLAQARSVRLHPSLLAPLRDLDTPDDARALRADPLLPARIASLLGPLETA